MDDWLTHIISPRVRPGARAKGAVLEPICAALDQSNFRSSIGLMEVYVSLLGRTDLSGEIYRQLRRAILDGRLRPRDVLPPTRELARRLSVSPTTGTVASDRLWGEGLVTSHVGAGTFVSAPTAIAHPPARGNRTASALQPR